MRLKIGFAKKNNAQIADIDPSICGACAFTMFFFTVVYSLWRFHTHYIQHPILFVAIHHFVEVQYEEWLDIDFFLPLIVEYVLRTLHLVS